MGTNQKATTGKRMVCSAPALPCQYQKLTWKSNTSFLKEVVAGGIRRLQSAKIFKNSVGGIKKKKKEKNSNNCLPPLSTNQDVANPGRCSFLQRNLRDGHEQQLLPRIIEHTLCYCGARRSHARGRSRGPGSSGLIEAQTWPSPLLTLLCHIHVWNTCVF